MTIKGNATAGYMTKRSNAELADIFRNEDERGDAVEMALMEICKRLRITATLETWTLRESVAIDDFCQCP